MDYAFKPTEKGYVFWVDVLILPMKKKHPTDRTRYFHKEVSFEEATSYYEYEGESIYHIRRDKKDRRLVRTNLRDYSPNDIVRMLAEGEISARMCKDVEEHLREHRSQVGPKVACTNNWSVEYDGQPVLLLIMKKPKMTYAEIIQTISNEGGYVDTEGIIHKGTAENKIYIVR